MSDFEILNNTGGKIIKAWTKGVEFDEKSKLQVRNIASLPFIHGWVAVMPDVHVGVGATIGSVVPTKGAIIPAAVGVDIGCGMMAVQTTLKASDLPDNLKEIRSKIERNIPHGRSNPGGRDAGAWGEIPNDALRAWNEKLNEGYSKLKEGFPKIDKSNSLNHLGTLGTGNHFIEVCLDEADNVWFMLHSGSRGIGNAIGRHYIGKAQDEARRWHLALPDRDLAYFPEGTEGFDQYVEAVGWAQNFARVNREIMMNRLAEAVRDSKGIPPFQITDMVVNCHHNYVEKENHFGENVWVTRKGAVRARTGDLGIIPGSMGAKSFIVRGKGNPESFHSCSHGAGRVMSRTEAKKRFTVDDQISQTEGIECRKDKEVIDEIPSAYKDIDAVMAAQSSLVEIVHTLRQVVCVKG